MQHTYWLRSKISNKMESGASEVNSEVISVSVEESSQENSECSSQFSQHAQNFDEGNGFEEVQNSDVAEVQADNGEIGIDREDNGIQAIGQNMTSSNADDRMGVPPDLMSFLISMNAGINDMRAEMQQNNNDLRSELSNKIDESNNNLRSDFNSLKSELENTNKKIDENINNLRSEIKENSNSLRSELCEKIEKTNDRIDQINNTLLEVDKNRLTDKKKLEKDIQEVESRCEAKTSSVESNDEKMVEATVDNASDDNKKVQEINNVGAEIQNNVETNSQKIEEDRSKQNIHQQVEELMNGTVEESKKEIQVDENCKERGPSNDGKTSFEEKPRECEVVKEKIDLSADSEACLEIEEKENLFNEDDEKEGTENLFNEDDENPVKIEKNSNKLENKNKLIDVKKKKQEKIFQNNSSPDEMKHLLRMSKKRKRKDEVIWNKNLEKNKRTREFNPKKRKKIKMYNEMKMAHRENKLIECKMKKKVEHKSRKKMKHLIRMQKKRKHKDKRMHNENLENMEGTRVFSRKKKKKIKFYNERRITRREDKSVGWKKKGKMKHKNNLKTYSSSNEKQRNDCPDNKIYTDVHTDAAKIDEDENNLDGMPKKKKRKKECAEGSPQSYNKDSVVEVEMNC